MTNQNLKEIKPGIGLGDLKFGLTRNDVKKMLGEPDESEKYSYTDTDEDLTETWHYDDLELSVNFDEEFDWRLSAITVSSEEYVIKDTSLIGLERDKVFTTLESLGFKNMETEESTLDDGSEGLFIISDEQAINFWIEEGVLTEIQWGPFMIDDEAVIWPE
jgi:hypothetical protein